jgi:hypothetical protein
MDSRHGKACVDLKERITTAPILTYYSPERQCIAETNASDFALWGVISQKNSNNKLHPIACQSRKFSPTAINYEIYDEELLAVVDSFEIWRKYLEGTLLSGLVYTDHHNLEYFTTTTVLNRRQAHWSQELAGIDFTICYRPGSQNGKPEILSKRSVYRHPKGGSEEQPIQTSLQEKHYENKKLLGTNKEGVIIAATKLPYKRWINWNKDFLEEVKEEGAKDKEYLEALQSLGKDNEKTESTLHQEEGVIYRNVNPLIPCGLRDRVLQSEHDSKVSGHMG